MDQDLENSMNNCESLSGIIKTDVKSLQNGRGGLELLSAIKSQPIYEKNYYRNVVFVINKLNKF